MYPPFSRPEVHFRSGPDRITIEIGSIPGGANAMKLELLVKVMLGAWTYQFQCQEFWTPKKNEKYYYIWRNSEGALEVFMSVYQKEEPIYDFFGLWSRREYAEMFLGDYRSSLGMLFNILNFPRFGK